MIKNQFFWLLLLAVAVPQLESSVPEPKNTEESLSRIFLGRETIAGEMPFVVRIQEELPSSPWYKSLYQYCSGVVIHPQWILSSVPCGYPSVNSTKKLWVYPKNNCSLICTIHGCTHHCTGSVDPEYVTASQIFYVDQPENKWYSRQLLLIKLQTALRAEGIVATLANLTTDPYDRIKDLRGFRIRIAGYGATAAKQNNLDDYVAQLRMTYMLMDNQTGCILPGTQGSDTYYICLSGGYEGAAGCFADTGGPMVYVDPVFQRDLVIGIMNDYAAGCWSTPFDKGQVFGTRVAPFRDRIQQIMGNDMLLEQ